MVLFCLTACSFTAVDGPDMMYNDRDYRTSYANALDFDSFEGNPRFAVIYLGRGDRMKERDEYVKNTFKNLSEQEISDICHFDLGGDRWYLIVPRYKDAVDIKDLRTGNTHKVYQGEAFTVKCDPSGLELSTDRLKPVTESDVLYVK